MSKDMSKEADAASAARVQAKSQRSQAAKGLAKERLAAALRENLKRRKAQISARRDETPPQQTEE